MSTLDQRIIQFRQSKGLTQAEFARKLEMFPQQIYRYEKNKATPPYEFFKKVVELWPEVNMNWLISGSGDISLEKENELLAFYRALGENKKLVVEGFIKQKYGEELEGKTTKS
jgi:transcriptional regulator with XRE-family HTH domain